MNLIKIILYLILYIYEIGLYYNFEWDKDSVHSSQLQQFDRFSEIKNRPSVNGISLFIYKNAKYYPKYRQKKNLNNSLYSEKISIVWKNTSNRIIYLPLDLSYLDDSFTENSLAYKEQFIKNTTISKASRFFTHLLVAQSDEAKKPRQVLTPTGFYAQLFMKIPTNTTQIAALKPGEVYIKELNLREFYGKAFDSDSPRSFWISVLYDNHVNTFFPVFKGEYHSRNNGQQVFIPTWTGVIESNTLQIDVR